MVSLRQEKNRKWSTLKIQKLNANLTADSHLYLGKWLELRQRQTSHEFPGGAVVKNLPASAGDTGDTGSIPGSGRSPGEAEWQSVPVFLPGNMDGEPGGLQSTGSKRVGHD